MSLSGALVTAVTRRVSLIDEATIDDSEALDDAVLDDGAVNHGRNVGEFHASS